MRKFKQTETMYAFNREWKTIPEENTEKLSPPISEKGLPDNKNLFIKPEKSPKEKAQEYMDDYRRSERALIVNFYTGGTKYSKGILDSIYRGANLLG